MRISNTPAITLNTKRLRIRVRGIVQGVGFRPFIYRLAQEHSVAGWVRNTSSGVEIEAEGEHLETFLADLQTKAPRMARIADITVHELPIRGEAAFAIRQSRPEQGKHQLLSPDIATCRECVEEIFSPRDRRYRYPFTNCTHCGPRFTIIEDIPYDRPRTTMKSFRMCPDCQREYECPSDRRFHAQPNACPACGPSLSLLTCEGKPIPCGEPLTHAAQLLLEGKIVAVKGLGGFLLACDATQTGAVRTLRERKSRPAKPFAVMLAKTEQAERFCFISDAEKMLLESPQAPIVLLRSKEQTAISPEVAPALRYLGVMLPYTPLHHLLMREVNRPLVMTSGNAREEPIAVHNEEALERLSAIADCFLIHNREIRSGYDDSVYMVEEGKPRAIRRARGYAPDPIPLPFALKPILACGAEEKNTFCLTRDRYAFLSQHIGDMENALTMSRFEETIELYKKLFRIEPEIIACDMHPEYLSTLYAERLLERHPGMKRVLVQHHHAHILSCLAENGAEGPVIGVAFDGTGYGPDGTIWGGEFLIADCTGFQRAGHLEPVPMPGATAAIRKPYRMAIGYLRTFGVSDFTGLPLLDNIDPTEVGIIQQQIKRRINAPLTSSMGRLFDAVAAMCGVRGEITYEAQAAIELEMLAMQAPREERIYPFTIEEVAGCDVVRLGGLLREVASDVRNGTPPVLISGRFHRTVSEFTAEMCQRISRKTGLKRVALSGGVFQNRVLVRCLLPRLRDEGFEVFTHALVPPNDGGLSLGQAIAAHLAK